MATALAGGMVDTMATEAGVVRGGNFICGIPVRVKLRESHSIENRLTNYAVEDRKSISDHVIAQPNAVDITFEMTNTDGGWQEAKNSYDRFLQILDARMPITVYTEHAKYDNMVVVGFRPDHRAPFKGAFTATIRLQQAGVIGAARNVQATVPGGRLEETLAGASAGSSALGLTARFTPVQARGASNAAYETVYRTGVLPVNAGVQGTLDNAPLKEKVVSKLADYSRGIFANA